jgi:hypothetical protein
MKHSNQIVISASRRTDIPAFYMDWFMEQIKKGVFEVSNPYNRRKVIVPATPDKIHTIVFWSKNFAPFIKGGFGEKLLRMGFNLFFNFTINSDSSLLEPWVPSLKQRLDQLRDLCRDYDPRSINWRFDPICFFEFKQNAIKDNLHDFSRIATWASQCGVTRCITSFMDHYAKLKKRIKSKPGFSFIDPILSEKVNILLKMEKELTEKNVDLYTCCEKEVLNALPSGSNIRKSSCIPNDLFVKIFGGDLSFKRDTGQRSSKGCGCMISVDIGSYRLHPCYNNCLFCYANPTKMVFRKNSNFSSSSGRSPTDNKI